MPRFLVAAVTILVGLSLIGCGTGSDRARSQSSVDAESCASAVREEFARQQSLVYWPVYCPSDLPDGFRLAAPDDPADPNLGGGAAPTQDALNPGGGTFITRLIASGGGELVIVQAAGASIYVRRDESIRPGGASTPVTLGLKKKKGPCASCA